MADIGIGVRNNEEGTPSSLPTVDVVPPNAAAASDKDVMDFLTDLHKKAIKAIEDYKAKVSGGESKEKLYSAENVIETLNSIQDPAEQVAFYRANREMIGKALIARSVK